VPMNKPLHYWVFALTVVWTLALLWLGSVVHATGSSLACPDWPTCFGSMTPEMVGGVFWEHSHRLVAGGLILVFLLGTALAWRPEAERPWIRRWCVIGIAALLFQALLGGLTVIFRLPPAISTSHLAVAYLFLGLAVVLTLATGPSRAAVPEPDSARAGSIRRFAIWVSGLVFMQSLVGAAVRHTEAGMACPDVPLCLGRIIPPMANGLIAIHFTHRVLGYVVALSTIALLLHVRRQTSSPRLRALAAAATLGVIVQVGLGFASVYTTLGVTPVSLHTLVAATVLAVLAAMVTLTWPARVEATTPGSSPVGETAAAEGALGGR